LALFTTKTDLYPSVVLRSTSKSRAFKTSIEPNDLGFGAKKIPAHKETRSRVSGRIDTETENYEHCLKCSEASGKTFACLNALWFRLYHTFTRCWLALVMAYLGLKGETLQNLK